MRFVSSALSVVVVVVAGCEQPGTNCTLEAAASVNVEVRDIDGAAVVDADVRYTVDGGDSEACDNFDDGRYACGYEIAGEFVVTATKAGYAAAQNGVTVKDDECHVVGESLDLLLLKSGPALP